MHITEEFLEEVKQFLGEGHFDTSGKPMWTETDISHMNSNRVPMTPKIGGILFSNYKITTFHVTSLEGVKGIKKLVQQNKPISSFTFMDKGMVERMSGIQTNGGVIFEVIGKTLYVGNTDIMSRPDQRGKRWLDTYTVMPDSIGNTFQSKARDYRSKFSSGKMLKDVENKKITPEILRYVAGYIMLAEEFIKENSDKIRQHALNRNLGSSWNEILVYNIEARDVLWTTTRADWVTAFNMLKDKLEKGYELDNSDRQFMKDCRKKIHEIEEELQSFCTGEVRHTDDPHNAILWVLEKGGNINREQFQKKLDKMRADNIYNERI